MIYRPSKETLLRQGLIKRCPVDRKAMENLLGREHELLVNDFDQIRRKRHTLFYEPEIPCSRMEAEHALKTAESLLKVIRTIIQ